MAPQAVVPPSDHAKRAKYVCEKCGATFGRLDNLQRHVRLVCSSSISGSGSGSGSSSSSRKNPPSTRARNVDGSSKNVTI